MMPEPKDPFPLEEKAADRAQETYPGNQFALVGSVLVGLIVLIGIVLAAGWITR